MIASFLLARLREPSTHASAAVILAATGLAPDSVQFLPPELMTEVVKQAILVVSGVCTIIGILLREKPSK